MNLYRSFGNLMEAWVTEESSCPDSEWLGNNAKDSLTPSSDMGTNLRSESVDSGVETASCDTFLSTSCSVSTDNAEMESFMPQREGPTSASTSQSPVFSSPVLSSSSSSPHFSLSRPEDCSTSLLLKLEEALQRTDSMHRKDNPKALTVDEVLSRRPQAPFLPKRHASVLVRSQRTQSFGQRRTGNLSLPIRQRSDLCRRPLPMSYGTQRSEGLVMEVRKELSPGLHYLEQVCQMLEEIARQQMHNQVLQVEMDALWEDQDIQVPDTCQSDSATAEEDLSSPRKLENTDNAEHSPRESQRGRYGHFRQRSASDTTLSTLHLRKLNVHDRGQLMSTNDLLERVEGDREKQDSTKEETTKTNKNWRLKFGSFGKGESAILNTKGQQTQSSEKNSARRRLSQLFRRRRKTLPM